MADLRFLWCLGISWFVAFSGCGEPGDSVPVEGVITLDGHPMPGVQVLFDQPDLPPRENTGYIGKTDELGKFSLRSMRGGTEGIKPGNYRVSLTTAITDPTAKASPPPPGHSATPFYPESPPPAPERVPPAYRGGKLSFTVPEDGTDAANFDLKSR
jgi:hypothetical protein